MAHRRAVAPFRRGAVPPMWVLDPRGPGVIRNISQSWNPNPWSQRFPDLGVSQNGGTIAGWSFYVFLMAHGKSWWKINDLVLPPLMYTLIWCSRIRNPVDFKGQGHQDPTSFPPQGGRVDPRPRKYQLLAIFGEWGKPNIQSLIICHHYPYWNRPVFGTQTILEVSRGWGADISPWETAHRQGWKGQDLEPPEYLSGTKLWSMTSHLQQFFCTCDGCPGGDPQFTTAIHLGSVVPQQWAFIGFHESSRFCEHQEIWWRNLPSGDMDQKESLQRVLFFVYCICAKGSSLPYLPFFDTYWSVHRCVPQCNRYALYPSWLVVQPISNNPSLLGMIIPNHGGNDIFRRQHIPFTVYRKSKLKSCGKDPLFAEYS